ncbi:nuclear pore complex protein NUP58-like isoform X3 [Panicum virgatum]|uniref:nuclear pore complex protein NUP58-like isoform X3 n=1 Tax=Panicum virgatum TaxID=38727 RepID=UPI0019D634B8|nr:nuclear pore complex protein NUP58-like isoform X3 [Panicum virgatum]
MPGLDWDLNLDPELQAAARRLSFSDADFPSSRCGLSDLKVPHPNPIFHATSRNQSRLPTISENTSDELAATQAPALEQCTGPPLSLGTAGWLYQGRGETPTPTAGAPVATSLPLASPGSSQSQQFLDAGAAARMLEQRRQAELLGSFGEHQQRRQQGLAADAGLQQAAAAARPQPQVLMLYTVDGGAAGYDTKWDELHPVSQGLLLQIEDNIREYRYDSEQLDECSHLDDLSPFNFEFDAGQITQQEAASISTIMDREKISIESLMTVIKEIIWNTDFAIRSYVKLRPRFVRLSAGIANHSGSSDAQTDFSQLLTMAPSFHRYSSAARRPSPFVQHTVARFEDQLGECCKWILELEQRVQMKDKTFAEPLESLSKVVSNIHDYLMHVASKVEHNHQSAETMKTQYLKDRRCRDDWSNPFHKANRREEAKQQATAGIIHPMLHLSPLGQPTTLVAVPMISSQLQQTLFPIVATSPSSYPVLASHLLLRHLSQYHMKVEWQFQASIVYLLASLWSTCYPVFLWCIARTFLHFYTGLKL